MSKYLLFGFLISPIVGGSVVLSTQIPKYLKDESHLIAQMIQWNRENKEICYQWKRNLPESEITKSMMKKLGSDICKKWISKNWNQKIESGKNPFFLMRVDKNNAKKAFDKKIDFVRHQYEDPSETKNKWSLNGESYLCESEFEIKNNKKVIIVCHHTGANF